MAASALVIKISDDNTLPYANSIIVTGNFIGHILRVRVALIIYDKFSWFGSIGFLILLILLANLQLLFFKEDARQLEIKNNKINFKDMGIFSKKIKFGLLLLCFKGLDCVSFLG
ncbi:hypothetical protein [Campylobacter blaseri]|uniref:hypothetical protein n=1 Tax=Campylobacter blaseri TaxID=2042961 RepID=UPI003B987B0B